MKIIKIILWVIFVIFGVLVSLLSIQTAKGFGPNYPPHSPNLGYIIGSGVVLFIVAYLIRRYE